MENSNFWLFLTAISTVCLLQSADADDAGFAVEEQKSRLVITHSGQPVAEYVFQDETIHRPFFANVHAPGGSAVTRHFPPRAEVDLLDHASMHPGIWLAFGDINHQDFWRNKARIRHQRFVTAPTVSKGMLIFATESELLSADEVVLGRLDCRFHLSDQSQGWLLIWTSTITPQTHDMTFGDQEEMGFGARVATPLIEKNGGTIKNSAGVQGAQRTWGQPAQWCDYSQIIKGKCRGITLMADEGNFRESWWHNRDYGLFVANPFGRQAMQQGAKSSVTITAEQPFHMTFGAYLHDATEYDPAQAYHEFVGQRRQQ